jgi:hypothetical protein
MSFLREYFETSTDHSFGIFETGRQVGITVRFRFCSRQKTFYFVMVGGGCVT